METYQCGTDTEETKVKPKRSSADSCCIAVKGIFTNSQCIYNHSEMLFPNVQNKVNGAMISCAEYMTHFGTAKEDFFQTFCKASSTSDNLLPGAATVIPLDLLR